MRRNTEFPEPKAFLTPEQVDEAIDFALAAAEAEGIQAIVVGGAAMRMYGSPRMTVDVDIAASDPIQALSALRPLSFGGYKSRTPNGVEVDVVVRDDEYADLYSAAINDPADIDGTPVIKPSYLAAMKMAANRRKDWADLEFLVTAPAFETAGARRVIAEYLGEFAAREFDAFVQETQWRAVRGEL